MHYTCISSTHLQSTATMSSLVFRVSTSYQLPSLSCPGRCGQLLFPARNSFFLYIFIFTISLSSSFLFHNLIPKISKLQTYTYNYSIFQYNICEQVSVIFGFFVLMASVCYGGETKTSTPVEPSSKAARKRRMEIHQFNIVPTDVTVMSPENGRKSQKREASNLDSTPKEDEVDDDLQRKCLKTDSGDSKSEGPKFGLTSVCGQRRDMEDAVAIHPSFSGGSHFYGVYDGHGCSHVAMKCKERMHEIVKDQVENRKDDEEWLETMTKSFSKMDEEVTEWSRNSGQLSPNCRCELQTPHCDAVGSTAVVALVTKDKIIVSNCGDSRAVISRAGVVTPLSNDHKPDRPDELKRIEDSGGRVIYWDGARVLGVLAMSRAIGDNYLKPYVISEPEVTVIDRTPEDECLVLASDGLWDVVSNETACGVARMCLSAKKPKSRTAATDDICESAAACESSDKACSDASILLTKLALARHTADNVSVVVVDLRKDL